MEHYSAEKIRIAKGLTYTDDCKYILINDGTDHSYWHEIDDVTSDSLVAGIRLGHTSYDYVYPTGDKVYYAEKLNKVLKKDLQ